MLVQMASTVAMAQMLTRIPSKGVAVGGALTSNYFTGYIDELIRTDQVYSKLHSNDSIYQGVAGIRVPAAHGARVQCYNHTAGLVLLHGLQVTSL